MFYLDCIRHDRNEGILADSGHELSCFGENFFQLFSRQIEDFSFELRVVCSSLRLQNSLQFCEQRVMFVLCQIVWEESKSRNILRGSNEGSIMCGFCTRRAASTHSIEFRQAEECSSHILFFSFESPF